MAFLPPREKLPRRGLPASHPDRLPHTQRVVLLALFALWAQGQRFASARQIARRATRMGLADLTTPQAAAGLSLLARRGYVERVRFNGRGGLVTVPTRGHLWAMRD